MNTKYAELESWIQQNNIPKESVQKVFEMLNLGKRTDRTPTDPIQFPSCYIRDDLAKPWHEPQNYPWVSILEENFAVIKDEALQIFEQNLMSVHPENDDLAGYGTWNTFFFYKNGTKYLDNHKKCPKLSQILSQIPGIDIAGRTYFSAMTPGIHIKPHCGPHNFKLRTHLGIVTHPKAVIRVGQDTRSWIQEKCIVFDDSFEHEVWNKSDITRIVLIVDVWNPTLTQKEIAALEHIMPEFYKRCEIM